VERFAIGLAKKVLIADTLATPTDQIFAISNHAMPMSLSIFGVVLFSLQIYFDFSGYSDMAIGLARIFGYRFHENFDRPYSARSIREFWRRWHISLSTWFRDYVYRPLGGNRRDGARTIANLVTVFLLCGFWHGASWTFIVWGAYHGAFLAIERTPFGRLLAQLPGWMQRAYTLAVVAVGWAIFRAADLDQAAAVLGAMFGAAPWANPMYPVQLYSDPFLLLILAVASMIALGVRPKPGGALLLSPVRLATMPLLLAISAAAVAASTHKAFIYFRF
jgi:alginate O-acetyltransferase complex protein AlgI